MQNHHPLHRSSITCDVKLTRGTNVNRILTFGLFRYAVSSFPVYAEPVPGVGGVPDPTVSPSTAMVVQVIPLT